MYTYIHRQDKKELKNWTTSFFSTNKIWSYCGDARWAKYIKCVSAESEVVLVLSLSVDRAINPSAASWYYGWKHFPHSS